MAKQTGPVKLEGTIDNICFYEMDGKWYARLKSSLTGKRVKKDPRFRRTMEYAGMLAQASRLASGCYRNIPKEERAYSMYRAMVGMAMQLLKMGWDAEEISVELEKGVMVASAMVGNDVVMTDGVMASVVVDDVVVPDVLMAPVVVVDDVVTPEVVTPLVVVDDVLTPDVITPAVVLDNSVVPDVAATPASALPRLYVNNTGQLVSGKFHNDWSILTQKYFTPHHRIPRVLRC